MSNIFITTTGATPSIILNDLGERIFVHPLTNYDISGEFKYQELVDSADFSNALDSSYLTVSYNGVTATSSSGFSPAVSSGFKFNDNGSSNVDVWSAQKTIEYNYAINTIMS